VTCAEHIENTSPNARGSCVVCGHLLDPPRRNPGFERDFLTAATKRAGVADTLGFDRQVLARLDIHPGEEFLSFSLERFSSELSEEGHDIAGWALGAAQCDDLQTYDEDRRQLVLDKLTEIAADGARAELHVRQLRSLLE
jgi:hypothetical protein